MDLREAGPLLVLAIVIAVGLLFGAAARRLRLPGVTGQILAGVLMGEAGIDLFGTARSHGTAPSDPLEVLAPLMHFALGLMAVTVGAHLNLRRLRNAGKRLAYLVLFEATVTPVLVFLGFWAWGVRPGAALLFATSAIATAPATTVALVREARAKGVFVKTLVAAVALNNMACMFLFELARPFASLDPGSNDTLADVLGDVLAGPGRQFVLAIGIGGLVAVAVEVAARYVHQPQRLAAGAVVALVFTSGMSTYLEASPLLACLFLGLVQTNISRTRDRLVDTVFEDFVPVILAVFFTLAGMHLSFEQAGTAGVLIALLFSLRALGKILSADLAMRIARGTESVRKHLGLALVPQAGVAVALVILVQEDPQLRDIAPIFSAVVLTVVTMNEIVGPFLVRRSLQRSGEAGMARMRLIDFLHEEDVQTDFHASSKKEAIEKLVDFLIKTHHLPLQREQVLDSVLRREAQASTCMGGGLSVPHGILPEGHRMVGVMALSREGLDFPTPDGRPVHCIVLLGTSPEESDRHLQVLAALARTIGLDPAFQALLFNAQSPAHASELLHGEESVHFNTFLEDED